MDTYPTLPTIKGKERYAYKIDLAEATTGAIWTMHQSDRRRRIFTIEHPRVTESVKNEILAFFDGHRGPFLYTPPNETQTYTVLFTAVPEVTPIKKGQWYDVAVQMREV